LVGEFRSVRAKHERAFWVGASHQRSQAPSCSLATSSTPHHRTPVAGFFNNVLGQQILRVLSISTMYSLRAGRPPVGNTLGMAKLSSGAPR
jgi:hypothetical protein